MATCGKGGLPNKGKVRSGISQVAYTFKECGWNGSRMARSEVRAVIGDPVVEPRSQICLGAATTICYHDAYRERPPNMQNPLKPSPSTVIG